jgi:hypothetical protein
VKSSGRIVVAVAVLLLVSSTAHAAGVDFKDPRRALGREDNIRVDAQMLQDTISPGTAISVTYQIENLSEAPIAIADKVADATFDPDSQTITLSIGAEIPPGAAMPHLATIAPGQTRTFRIGAAPQMVVANSKSPWAHVPRFVQIIVNVLRDLGPFTNLLAQQAKSATPPPLPNGLFDTWVASVSSVELNVLPVRWSDVRRGAVATAETSRSNGSF